MKKIIKVLQLKKTRYIAIGFAVLLCIAGAYAAIDYPYIIGIDATSTVNKVSINSPITLHFSQNMNKQSVIDNFEIHPKIEGELLWTNGKTLEFKPSVELKLGDSFKVVIKSGAKNIYGKSLGANTSIQFIFSGPPVVKFVSPYIKNSEFSETSFEIPFISSDQIITVMFDRPMDWPEDEESLLEIQPSVKGEYRFLGMSAFQFIPESWPTGKSFRLTVPSGVQARDGGETEELFKWQIATSPLRATLSMPSNGDENVSTNSPLIIKFNQPVDLEQIQPGNNAMIYPSNDVDADKNPKFDGFFNTEVTYGKDENGITDKSILVFSPTFPYTNDTEYKFVLKSGLSGDSDDEESEFLGMKEDFEINFKTAMAPGVIEFIEPSQDFPNAVLKFSTEMSAEEIKKHLVITPENSSPVNIIMSKDGKEAGIDFSFISNIDYSIELETPLSDVLGNKITKGIKRDFKINESQQKLKWDSDGEWSMFAKEIDPEFTLVSNNINELNLQLCQVSEGNFMTVNQGQNWANYNCSSEPVKYRVRPDGGSSILNLTSIFERNFEPGIYYFSVKNGDKKIFKIFLVTDTSLMMKKSHNVLLLWATDIITGEPVSRMEVTLYDYSGEEIGRGVTDGDGIYKITRDFDAGVYAIGKQNMGGNKRWTIINDLWLSPNQGYSEVLNPEWIDNGEMRAYLMSEKNVLNTGDKIQIKGILRVDNDAQFALPEDSKVLLAIENNKQDILTQTIAPIRKNGSFDTSLEIPIDASSGNYSIAVFSSRGQRIKSNESVIRINADDSPFIMNWENPKNDYYGNEPISIELKANYFVGIPASSLKGSWELFRKPYYFSDYNDISFYSFGSENVLCSRGGCESDNEYVASGNFSFDSDGISKIIFGDKKDNHLMKGYEYFLTANANSIGGENVSKSTRFILHPGKQYIGLSTKHYILKQNENADVNIIVTDTKGNLIDDKEVNISLIKMDGEKEDDVKYDQEIIAGSEPINVSIPITSKMPAGIYKLKAESEDDIGNDVVSELEFYVVDNENKPVSDDLEILMDQSEYFVGGKALMLISYPHASAEKPIPALVTYERLGVLGYKIVELDSPLTEVSIPVIKEMVPNMFITVSLIERNDENLDEMIQEQEDRRKEIENRQSEVEIILLEEELALLQSDENSDQSDIEKLTNKIEALKSSAGDDSNSNVGSDGIDFIPIIKKSATNVIISNPEQVINIDITSEPIDPKPGDEVTIKIHTYDYQNRSIPSVVSLNVSEKQVGIIGSKALTLFDYFLRLRDSQVSDSSNISLFSKTAISNPVLSSYSLNQISEINTSAYFNPLILTDNEGHAEVSFTLPNKHMSWQIDALATSDENNFGSASINLHAKKRLAITPITPAFVMPGDLVTISAKIRNLSDNDIDTAVEILAENVEVKGGTKKNFSVKSGESKNVSWDIVIGHFYKDDAIKIAFRSREDYAETNLPVKKLKTYEALGDSGIIEDKWIGGIRAPQNAISDMGSLNISLSATPINIAENFANALGDYSLNSTEKLASLVIADISLLHPELSDMRTKNLIDEINSTINQLAKRQRADGGFAFFEGSDTSDPWLSAYTIYSLSMADGLFEIPSNMKQECIRYLWSALSNETLSNQFFILWALSEYGEYDTVKTLELYNKRSESTLAGKAFLLMNLQNLIDAGQKSTRSFLDKLQSEIVSEKINDDKWIYFQDTKKEVFDTNMRNTALVLFALSRMGDENPILIPIIQFLASSTTVLLNNFNPQEAVWILMALNEFTNEQELNVNLFIKAKVNNKTVIDESIHSENPDTIYSSIIKAEDLKDIDQINNIEITKEGSGNLYFNTSLTYSMQSDKITPIEENAVITRNYYTLEDFNEENSLKKLKSGILYRGVLTVVIPEDVSYIAIENPLPAGLKALSFNPAVGDITAQYKQKELNRSSGLNWIDNPLWNFDSYEIQNDRMLLYADDLPAGIYKIDYLVQAGTKGKFNHLPATVQQMFQSYMYGRTEGGWVEVK
ncbi:Ig-like domain-containing protein [Candidatus Peregrinibacteria bacterium]|nr:Ig-like domain-containing protein [Candidatus Peregrinibacteria bacterium]